MGLAAAAAVTKKIKLGTAICLVVEHDPIVLAKLVASLDLLSGGRFIFGIGAGWNAEEMENHGTVFDTRYRLMRERMDAMKAMWTQEEAEYHGKFVNFDPLWSYPKPAQKPWPPIFFGGHTPAARQRVVDLYDGWMPTIMRVQDLLAGVADLRRRAAEAGRDPKSIDVTVLWVRADRARLDSFEAAGVDRVVLGVPSADARVVSASWTSWLCSQGLADRSSAMSTECRVAIVTGASRGIGKQIALRLARNGINLVIAARTMEAGQGRWPGSLEETAAQVRELGAEATPVKCDVTQRAEVEALCQTALAKYGGVDILVNNALYLGPGNYNPFLETAFETWDRNLEANLMAAVVASKACLPAMVAQHRGVILNLTSAAADH